MSLRFNSPSPPSGTRPANGSSCRCLPCPNISGILSPSPLAPTTLTSPFMSARLATSPRHSATLLVPVWRRRSCMARSTPWACILKNIWHLRNGPNPPTRLRRVEFVWVCRDTTSFEWFQALLSSLENQSPEAAGLASGGYRGGIGGKFLNIHTYLTQKLDIDTTQNIVLNSVGSDVDPLTELKSYTNFGRPNFFKMFAAVGDGILDQTYLVGLEGNMRTTVGVYFCGPSAAGM